MHARFVLCAVALALCLAVASAAPVDVDETMNFEFLQTDDYDGRDVTEDVVNIKPIAVVSEEDRESRGYHHVNEEPDLLDEEALLAPLRDHVNDATEEIQMTKNAANLIVELKKLLDAKKVELANAQETFDSAVDANNKAIQDYNTARTQKGNIENALGILQAEYDQLRENCIKEMQTRAQEVQMIDQLLEKLANFCKEHEGQDETDIEFQKGLQSFKMTATALLGLSRSSADSHPDMESTLVQIEQHQGKETDQIKELLDTLRARLTQNPCEAGVNAKKTEKANKAQELATFVENTYTPAKVAKGAADNAKATADGALQAAQQAVDVMNNDHMKQIEDMRRDVTPLEESTFSGDMCVQFDGVDGEGCRDSGKTEQCPEGKTVGSHYETSKGAVFSKDVVNKADDKARSKKWIASCKAGDTFNGGYCEGKMTISLVKPATRVGFVPLGDFGKLHVVLYGSENDEIVGKIDFENPNKGTDSKKFKGWGAVGLIKKIEISVASDSNGGFAIDDLRFDGFSAQALHAAVQNLEESKEAAEKEKEQLEEQEDQLNKQKQELQERLEQLGSSGDPVTKAGELGQKLEGLKKKLLKELQVLSGKKDITADEAQSEAKSDLAELRALADLVKADDDGSKAKFAALRNKLALRLGTFDVNDDPEEVAALKKRLAILTIRDQAHQRLAGASGADDETKAALKKYAKAMDELVINGEKRRAQELERKAESTKKILEIIAMKKDMDDLEKQLKDPNKTEGEKQVLQKQIRDLAEKILEKEQQRLEHEQKALGRAKDRLEADKKILEDVTELENQNAEKRKENNKIAAEIATLRELLKKCKSG